MPNLTEVFPNAKTLLELEPEELSDVILELVHREAGSGRIMFSLAGIMDPIGMLNTTEWPQGLRSQIEMAVAESMAWLEHAGLSMPDPTQGSGTSYRTLTRRGRQLQSRGTAAAFREAEVLPLGFVHPQILERSHASFTRGDHDIAVFAAFKAIEVAVRKACGFPDGELGVPLMRKAFHPDNGLLTDKSVVAAEREAMSALFAGAIGVAKTRPATEKWS